MIVHGEELLVPAHLNFGKFILDGLRKAKPDAECLVDRDTGNKLTNSEFAQHAVSLSMSLSELGVGRGDTVAVAAESRVIAFMPTCIAVVLTGATLTPIKLQTGKAILAHHFNLSRPKYVICSRLFWEEYKDILKGLDFIKTFICFEDIEEIKLSLTQLVSRNVNMDTFEPVVVRGETDVALVFYSSGTTGSSRAVQLTHLNCIVTSICQWLHNCTKSMQTRLHIGDQKNACAFLTICYFFYAGKRVVYVEEFDSRLVLNTIQDCQVDIIITIPSRVEALLNAKEVYDYDLSSLKVIYSNGWPLDPKTAKALEQRHPNLKVLQMYGATEVSLLTAQLPTQWQPALETLSVGVAAPGVTLKVVDVETREILGPNQRGEICAGGPSLMKGYIGAEQDYKDKQGFYPTGDLGYYDDQKQFYVVDRLKDIFVSTGYKVAPGNLEMILLKHPSVLEAAVVGAPTAAFGQAVPAAFVVLRPGETATESELVDHVAREVPHFMQLNGGVRFISELPRNEMGKLLRRKLLEKWN